MSAGDNGSLLGLGFGQSFSLENGSVEELMQHYLQQCLEFHHEQQQQQVVVVGGSNPDVSSRVQKDETAFVDGMPVQRHEEPQFVAPIHCEDTLLNPVVVESSTAGAAVALPLREGAVCQERNVVQSFSAAASPPLSATTASVSSSDSLAAAMAKAKAVVQTFQTKRPQAQSVIDTYSTLFLSTMEEQRSPQEYKSRRLAFFVKEQARLERAMCQNFDYLAKREAERLRQQLQQIEATKQLEQNMMIHQQQQHEQRLKAMQNNCRAGIGTNQQRTVSRKRKTDQDENATKSSTTKKKNNKKRSQDESAASLYVCNIPKTMLPQEDGDNPFMHQLFSSYGKIRKMHFYRDKETGMFKGDALVVYEFRSIPSTKEDMNNVRDFLQSICTQTNGCELPCGSILKVEPASKSYHDHEGDSSSVAQSSLSHYGPAVTARVTTNMTPQQTEPDTCDKTLETALESSNIAKPHTMMTICDENMEMREETNGTKDQAEEDEDLDDFFASLT